VALVDFESFTADGRHQLLLSFKFLVGGCRRAVSFSSLTLILFLRRFTSFGTDVPFLEPLLPFRRWGFTFDVSSVRLGPSLLREFGEVFSSLFAGDRHWATHAHVLWRFSAT